MDVQKELNFIVLLKSNGEINYETMAKIISPLW